VDIIDPSDVESFKQLAISRLVHHCCDNMVEGRDVLFPGKGNHLENVSMVLKFSSFQVEIHVLLIQCGMENEAQVLVVLDAPL
jgi:hypothetical protein